MRRRHGRWLTGLLFIAALPALAQQSHNASSAEACNSGSARTQSECAARQLMQAERALEQAEATLRSQLPDDDSLAHVLSQSQASWKQYREDSCVLQAGISGGDAGWIGAQALQCQAELTTARAALLQRFAECRYIGGEACP